jgi:hypothetical protein
MKRIPSLVRVVALCAIGLTLNSMGVAAGGNPGRQPAPTPPDILVDVCGPVVGTVLGQVIVNNEYLKTFVEKDGTIRIAINGASTARFTRLSTGKTLDFNESGPGAITIKPDGTVIISGTGQVVAIDQTGIWHHSGPVEVRPDGSVAFLGGHTTDICGLLL